MSFRLSHYKSDYLNTSIITVALQCYPLTLSYSLPCSVSHFSFHLWSKQMTLCTLGESGSDSIFFPVVKCVQKLFYLLSNSHILFSVYGLHIKVTSLAFFFWLTGGCYCSHAKIIDWSYSKINKALAHKIGC